MKDSEFVSIDPPVRVLLKLRATEDGGRTTPLSPEERFRPEMFLSTNERQFWGELRVVELLHPGNTGEAILFGSTPKDLQGCFTSGNVINLRMSSHIGWATVV